VLPTPDRTLTDYLCEVTTKVLGRGASLLGICEERDYANAWAQASIGERARQSISRCDARPLRPAANPRLNTSTRGVCMEAYEDVRERQQRAARNQSLFREVNERVKDINDHFYVFTPLSEWVCECANDDCVERIEMSAREYEHVRSDGARFFVSPSDQHVWPEVERVVERLANYWIVEKIELGAKIAIQQDPRSDGPLPLRT
jgi:hypothetical protein